MKRYLSLIIALALTTICFAKTKSINYDYDIVGVSTAKVGYYLVEVTAVADKKKDATLDLAKKCAIHGCLFKGFAATPNPQKPIVSSPSSEQEHPEFFAELLNEKYNNYTTCSYPLQIIKLDKGYRIKTIVLVAKDLLRKDLEKLGVINKLGF